MTVILQLVCTNILYRICAYIIYIQKFLQRPACLPANYDHFIERDDYNLSSVAMVLKHWHDHLKTARKGFVTLFKKRKSEANSFLTLDYCKIDYNKLSTTNTSNMKNDFQTWFGNKSTNRSKLDSKKEGNYRDDGNVKNLEEKHSKTEEKTSS